MKPILNINKGTIMPNFVVLPPYTENGHIIFGKNADRPEYEVQEVVYEPAARHQAGAKVMCTYIEIDQVERTNAVVLSKPAWTWGAEMGANDKGVVVGNASIWTKLTKWDDEERLLGLDLVRLGLERSDSARQCLEIIGQLLEAYGQGGICCEDAEWRWTYHNSFLVVDCQEAWIMETTDRLWVARKVDGFAHTAYNATIGTEYTMKSARLEEVAIANGLWKPSDGQLHFKNVFEDDLGDEPRLNGECKLLEENTRDGLFNARRMMSILRSGEYTSFGTAGSQVSILPTDPCVQCVHFFTATPDPRHSVFKPFVFGSGQTVSSPLTKSPIYSDSIDPAKRKPRFQKKIDRRHELYKTHQAVMVNPVERRKVLESLLLVEQNALDDIGRCLRNKEPIADAENLFNEAVEAEMRILTRHRASSVLGTSNWLWNALII